MNGAPVARTVARRAPLLAAFLAAAAAGCGGGEEDSNAAPRTTVVIAYEAPVTVDPRTAEAFPACVQAVGRTHVHVSWRGFGAVDMSPDGGGRWTATFADVPAGSRVRIRVNDPNRCDEHPTGAVTGNVLANGVPLTEVVETPGSGVEPGFAFTAAADGAVSP